MERFFRTSIPIYDQVRSSLDAAWGHPKTLRGILTVSCLPDSDSVMKDGQSRIYVGLRPIDLQIEEVDSAISNLLAQGQIEELSEDNFFTNRPHISPSQRS